jgi:hypothetical protein
MSYTEGTVRVSSLLSTLQTAITNPLGQTGPSNEASATLSGSESFVTLTLPGVGSGLIPSAWNIYRGTSTGVETFLTQIPGNRTMFHDDGSFLITTTAAPTGATGSLYALPNSPTGVLTASSSGSSFLSQSASASNAFYGIGYNQTVAQPFFANHALLTEIDLPLDITGVPGGNIIVSIYGTSYENQSNNGNYNVPASYGTTPLGSATVAIANMNHFQVNGAYTPFVFSSPVSLTVGNLYHIVISLDDSANTIGSGKYINVAMLSQTAGNTAVTPAINTAWTGSAQPVSTINGWAQVNGGNFNSLCYQIYSTGNLPSGTYYYKVTASTGWSNVFNQTLFFQSSNTYLTSNIYFSSGQNANEFIYAEFNINTNANSAVNVGILEYYDDQTHALFQNDCSVPTNGLGIAGTSKFYNFRYRACNFYSASQANIVNVSYRVHTYADHIALSLVGDSTISTFEEYVVFVGKITPISSTDKPYVISSDQDNTQNYGAEWLVLRDYTNTVNQKLFNLMPVNPQSGGTGTYNSFPYINKFTNNYDGIVMSFVDGGGASGINNSAGFRGTCPDMILFPSGISAVLNNHDTFTYNAATYKIYIPNNVRDFSNYFAGYVGIYYPAFRVA